MVADPTRNGEATSPGVRYLKILLLVAVVAVLNFGGSWFAQQLNFQVFPRPEAARKRVG